MEDPEERHIGPPAAPIRGRLAAVLRSQAEPILACDFFTADLPGGTQTCVLGLYQDQALLQPSRPLTRADQAGRDKFMIRGRGSNFTAAFEEILAGTGIRTVLCNVRTSRMSAIAERWIRDAAANSWTAPSLLAAAPGDRGTQSLGRDTRGETDVLRWRYVVIRKAWRLLIPAILGLLIHFTSVSPRCGNGGRNLADLAGRQ